MSTPDTTARSQSPILLRCEKVRRVFGSGPTATTAVRDVDAVVVRGARVALTGPSGSGKSTLLHLMAGLDRPTSGTIAWTSSPPANQPMRAEIGMIFQGPSLISSLDVTDNVLFPMLINRGVGAPTRAEAHARAAHALELLELAALAHKTPGDLSGGQSQRVAIARALAARPQIIFADEPTGQLDHDTATLVIDVLLRTCDEISAALVISTHDLDVAGRLPTRWTMSGGILDTTEQPDSGRTAQSMDERIAP